MSTSTRAIRSTRQRCVTRSITFLRRVFCGTPASDDSHRGLCQFNAGLIGKAAGRTYLLAALPRVRTMQDLRTVSPDLYREQRFREGKFFCDVCGNCWPMSHQEKMRGG